MHSGNRNSGQRNRTCTKPAVGWSYGDCHIDYRGVCRIIGSCAGGTYSWENFHKKSSQKTGKAAKGMGKAMKEANDRLRTKSGKLRKGKTQADVARLAHKIRRQKYA